MSTRGLMMKSCYTKILFLVQVLWQVYSTEGLEYFESVGRFNFDHVEPDWLSVPATGIGITYMEHDKYIPGNILYTESHSIKTLNPQTNETTVIAGSEQISGYREGNGINARFKSPFSFYQMNATSVLITDTENHCFRMLSRLSNATSMLAGLCTITGNRTGAFPSARFNEPYKVVEVEPGALAFTDSFNGNIKKLDCNNAEVSLLTQFNHKVFALAIRPGTLDVYFSFNGGFGSVDLDTFETIEYVTQIDLHGYRDGALRNYAVFTARPEALLFLSKDVMLVAGLHTHLIRVVNFVNEFVSSICDPEPEGNTTRSGEIETCQLSYPRSLLALREEERVLIGFHESIGFMGVSGLSHTITSTTSGSTPTTTTTSTSTTTPTTTITKATTTTTPAATTQTSTNPTYNPREPHTTVLSIGIIVGGVAFISLVVAGVLCFRKAYHRSSREPQQPMVTESSEPGTSDNVYDYIDNYRYSTANTDNLNIAYEQPRKASLPCNSSMPTFQAPGSPMQEEEPRYFNASKLNHPSQRPGHHVDGRSRNDSKFLPRQNFSIA